MAAVVLLRGALGLLGVISLPDDTAWLEISTLGTDDGNPASKMFKSRGDGGAGTASARAGGVTEATPLLGAGSAAPAFEGIRPKAASKDEDRACPPPLRYPCRGLPSARRCLPPGAAGWPWCLS